MSFRSLYIGLYENGELEDRAIASYEILKNCRLCPRECCVNRLEGEMGFCKADGMAMISSAGPHFGEEPPLVGAHGSGTIFLTNCNLGCVFCQNYDISQLGNGQKIDSNELANVMLGLQRMGCHNINFVTPTHYVPQILKSLVLAIKDGLDIPLVYNCGGYESIKVLKLLDGVFDIYMPDIKYGNNNMGLKYSKAPDYFDVTTKAVAEMYRQVGDLVINQEGIAVRGLLIRHLVMPNNVSETNKIIEFIAGLSKKSYVNIMDQYRPDHKAYRYPELDRRLSTKEFMNAISSARKLGLSRGFPHEI